MRHLSLLATLVVLAACGQQPTVSDDDTTGTEKSFVLDVPTFYVKSAPGLGDSLPWIAEQVELMSGGSVKMQVREPGDLLKSPKEILDAVSEGEVQAGFAAAGFWDGKIPAAPLFTAVPFGPEAPEYLAWLYFGNGMKLYQEMYDTHGYDVKVLVAMVSTPETSGWFREEIGSVDDLKGKRMRIFGFGGSVMDQLGVATTKDPGGEIFALLEKGNLDCAEYATPAVDATKGFHKVAKYNYYPGWHQQGTVFELLINKPTWNKLSDRQRAIIENACRAAVARSLAQSEALQPAAIRRNEEELGVQNRYWSPQMLAAFRRTWEQVAAEQAAKDPFFKKVWEDLQTFRAEYARWSRLGFLPRATGK